MTILYCVTIQNKGCQFLKNPLFPFRLGKRSKEQYHLALLDLYKEYGPIVKENIGGKDIGKEPEFLLFN